jgi:hypothetical protein
MTTRRKIKTLAEKMLRLMEVHIFFAMSIFAGNAVVKHNLSVAHKSHDKRQKVAIERSVPLAQNFDTGTVEEGKHSAKRSCKSLQSVWPLHFLHSQSAIWRSHEPALSNLGDPPCLAFNLLQQLAPLRI